MLSSIKVDKKEMGRQTVTIIIGKNKVSVKKNVEVLIPFELKCRESC
jgi:DNA-binding LacI/PurR family transcriptional regulator